MGKHAVEELKALFGVDKIEQDPMTGGPSSSMFKQFAPMIAEHEMNGQLIDILYINIEDFKSYNEEFGFEKGDRVIRKLGDIIFGVFEGRLAARQFGDQFVVMCYDWEAVPGIRTVNRDFQVFCRKFPLNIKVGIYQLQESEMDISAACDRAKIASDSIKRQYGVLYRVYDQELDNQITRQRYIVENIENAIAKEQIKVFYQPVIRTLTQEVCGVEALARWDDPKYGLMAPDILINTLEEYQLIHKLDSAIIDIVCREYAEEAAQGKELVPISLNLSRLDFELCDILAVVEETVQKYHVPKNMIHVEITESIFTKNPDFIKKHIMSFHQAGYEVWMDDFGSGYSSLNILKDYDFDVIKIDMLFLRNFTDKSKKIIAAIVDMAKRIGIRTLAEGVETIEQLEFLRNIGCEKAQGYLIGKPLRYMGMVEHLEKDGYSFEKLRMRKYYDDLGAINLLSTRPLEFTMPNSGEDESPDLTQGIPIAIWEFRGDRGRFLLTNKAFRNMLNTVGIFSPRAAEFDLNDEEQEIYKKMRDFAATLISIDEIRTLNYVINGNYCVIRGRCVSTFEDGSAFLVTAQNLSESYGVGKDLRAEDISPTMYSMFEMVDILYPEKNIDEPIFVQNSSIRKNSEGNLFSELRDEFAYTVLHPSDRGRFMTFMNAESMASRIENNSTGVLEDCFRVKVGSGGYRWKIFSLGLIKKGEKNRVLFCVRDMRMEATEQYEGLELGNIHPRVIRNLRELSQMKYNSHTNGFKS